MSRFITATGGNTAMIFALSILPISIAIGVSIDFQRAYVERSRLRDALDSSVLAAAREHLMAANLDKKQREAKATDTGKQFFLAALAGRKNRISKPEVTFTFTADNEIRAKGKGVVDTLFGGLLGVDSVDVKSEARAMAGDARVVEVTLMLDNTASMFSSNRFVIMREAAMNFVDTMYDESPSPELIRISVVPWSVMVNIKSETVATADGTQYAWSSLPPAGSRKTPNPAKSNRIRNITHPDTGKPMSKSALKTMFAPVPWRGCIRAGKNEIKTNASGGVSQPITDKAVSSMRWPVGWVKPEVTTRWYRL
ncbi:Tad domain-containing protein, partial [Oceanicaulis sp. AH-315-P02]|nr:Tad domain-containing protein [Oceanicaulis sp. AH-315-P02]